MDSQAGDGRGCNGEAGAVVQIGQAGEDVQDGEEAGGAELEAGKGGLLGPVGRHAAAPLAG